MNTLEIKNVTKKYGDFTAVDSVSLSVNKGEIFGLLGPNGAGKSSTIRMIMNITVPDNGEIHFFGEPFRNEFKNRIGYLPEERGLYPKMRVIEQLKFLGEMKAMRGSEAKKSGYEWLEKVGLAEWAKKPVNELSKGMAQKVQFIGTIIHNPEIIIMDEPFSGLDPVNSKFLKDILLELKNQNKCIILSTHLMESAEKLCGRIGLINTGKLVLEGNIQELKQKFSKNSVILKYNGDSALIKQLSEIKYINDFGNYMEINLNKEVKKSDFFKKLAELPLEITKFETTETSLEDIFIQHVGKREKNV
ncbi:MAG: ATP-binding cassette domain-containing protein [Candidatus Muiribacteriota bacterium]